MGYVDAHNHLQDERFAGRQAEIVDAARLAGVERMVVNGSCEEDWPAVADLARRFPDLVVPAFGLHPWYAHDRTPAWFDALRRQLDATPGSVIGEIGIDRWILDRPPAARAAVSADLVGLAVSPLAEQEEVFARQLELAVERGVSASIHCLQAWGRMHEILRRGPCPARGFLLHSYGGSAELVGPLARLGAWFGFPGYFLRGRKARQREVFRGVPRDRLLVETDAPDQRLPREPEWREMERGVGVDAPEAGQAAGDWEPRELEGLEGRPLNHPANLGLVYSGLAEVLDVPVAMLSEGVRSGFGRLFEG